MTGNERVILIKGDSSKWYEQAIFIVKGELPQDKIPVNFANEAEKIINNYLARIGSNKNTGAQPVITVSAPVKTGYLDNKNNAIKTKKRRKGLDLFLNISMITCCVLLATILYFCI